MLGRRPSDASATDAHGAAAGAARRARRRARDRPRPAAGRLRQPRGDRADRRAGAAARRRRRVERRRGPHRPRRPADERDRPRRSRSSRAGVPVAGEPVAVHDAARRGSSATPDQRRGQRGQAALGHRVRRCLDGDGADGLEASVRWSCSCSCRAPSMGDQRRLEVLRDRAVDRHRDVVHDHRPAPAGRPAGLGQPVVHQAHRLPARTRSSAATAGSCRGRTPIPRRSAGSATPLRRCAPITEVLLNYRRDGTAFWNQVSISPVFDGAGALVNFVGVQNDVTERVMVEQERRAALAEAEEARAQLRLLAEATTADDRRRSTSPTPARRLARIAVPAAGRPVRGGPGRPARRGHRRAGSPSRRATRGRGAAARARRRLRGYRAGHGERHRQGARRRRAAALVPELPERGADRYPDDPAAAAVFERLRLRSAMVVPRAGPRPRARRADAAHPAPLRPPLRPARRAPGRRPRRPRRAGRRQRPALRGRARRRG